MIDRNLMLKSEFRIKYQFITLPWNMTKEKSKDLLHLSVQRDVKLVSKDKMEKVTTADNPQFKKKLPFCNKQQNKFAINCTAQQACMGTGRLGYFVLSDKFFGLLIAQ